MDARNITRVALHALIVIIAAALVAGAVIMITRSVSTEPSDTSPPATDKPQSTDPPESDAPAVTEPIATEPPATEPPDTDAPVVTEPPVTVTHYDEPVTMYALYNVNARMKPTTESDIMGMIYQSEAVNVYGETDNGWYEVRFRGYEAYIRTDLLSADQSESAVKIETYDSPKTMYTQRQVNVRESYTTNSQSFEILDAGVEVTVIGITENGWYEISYRDGVAFISKDYLGGTMPVIPKPEPDREA